MKIVKISLIIIVVSAIAFFAIRSLVSIKKVDKISLPENQFTRRVDTEIASIQKLPDNNFSKEAYNNIKLLIDDYSNPHPPQSPNGRLGITKMENDQQRDNLNKNLYSAYAPKFIKQAFYVFEGTEWKIEDLTFIRSEYQELKGSKFLERESAIDNKFSEIQKILSKYDEIVSFIDGCKNFRYIEISINESRFPISDVQNKLSRTAAYRNNNLDNDFVNNCTRLQNGLSEVPQILFNAHVFYLNNKINSWKGKYANADYGFTTHADYSSKLNEPLQNEIEAMTNDIYHVANFEDEYNKLVKKWSDDNVAAYKYF